MGDGHRLRICGLAALLGLLSACVPQRPPAPPMPLPAPKPASPERPPVPAPPTAPQASGAIVTRSFTWTDFDRVEHTLRLTFPQADLDAAIAEFGCDPALLESKRYESHRSIHYTAEQASDPAEMARLHAQADAEMQAEMQAAEEVRRRQFLERGFMEIKADTISTDIASLWRWNRERMRGVADQLRAAAGGKDFTRAALAFVQELPYVEIPRTVDGRYVGGVLSPLEALAAGHGDCDTKALLFASLVDDGQGPEVIVLGGEEHMIAGLACTAEAPGTRVEAFGQTWQLCECSHGVWVPGHVAATIITQIDAGQFAPLRLRAPGSLLPAAQR